VPFCTNGNASRTVELVVGALGVFTALKHSVPGAVQARSVLAVNSVGLRRYLSIPAAARGRVPSTQCGSVDYCFGTARAAAQPARAPRRRVRSPFEHSPPSENLVSEIHSWFRHVYLHGQYTTLFADEQTMVVA
jgi:hypothetical protein